MTLEAVIFDMDGTLIDSEPFWSMAESEVFGGLGVPVMAPFTYETARMTTSEVTNYWYNKSPWDGPGLREVEQGVIDMVGKLIIEQGKEMPGAVDTVTRFYEMGVKIGLATNSPAVLIETVLNKLGIEDMVDVCCSSEFEESGKPHPAVYLSTVAALGINPAHCLAFEDSLSGLKSAKSAGLKTVAIPTSNQFDQDHWELADLKARSLKHFVELIPAVIQGL